MLALVLVLACRAQPAGMPILLSPPFYKFWSHLSFPKHLSASPASPPAHCSTLIIACNMCNQPREAMAVYRRMLEEGYSPNSTTYNALISAYGKAGQLDKVMEVFQVR